MGEDRGPGVDTGRGAPDLLERQAEAIYGMIQDAPDLDHGDTQPPPPADEDGDHRPDRDWKIVAVLAFSFAFALGSAWTFGKALARELV